MSGYKDLGVAMMKHDVINVLSFLNQGDCQRMKDGIDKLERPCNK